MIILEIVCEHCGRENQVRHPVQHQLDRIEQGIHHLKEQARMTQSDIDGLTAAVQAVATDLTSATNTITQEFATLEAEVAAGNPVDLTGMQTAVASLQGVQAGVDALTTQVPPPTT
jgi:hypothetical protein